MRFVLHCKCEFILILRIFGIFPLFVLWFLAKLWNVVRFATIEACNYTLPRRWIVRFALMQHHVVSMPWGSFSLCFDILCTKHAVTYSIVNSFINIISNIIICQWWIQPSWDAFGTPSILWDLHWKVELSQICPQIPKVHGSQNHLHFELLKTKFLFVKFFLLL